MNTNNNSKYFLSRDSYDGGPYDWLVPLLDFNQIEPDGTNQLTILLYFDRTFDTYEARCVPGALAPSFVNDRDRDEDNVYTLRNENSDRKMEILKHTKINNFNWVSQH